MFAEALIVTLAVIAASLIAGAAVWASYRRGPFVVRAAALGVGVLLAGAVAVLLQVGGEPSTRTHASLPFWAVVSLFAIAPPAIATLATVTICARLGAPRWLAFALTTAACLVGMAGGFVTGVLGFVGLAGKAP